MAIYTSYISIVGWMTPEGTLFSVLENEPQIKMRSFSKIQPLYSRAGAWHIGMPHSCEMMVLVKKLELEATELNIKTNNQKVHTPALVYN